MDCAQWWGPHFHWFWIIPFVFMILMVSFAVFLFRRGSDHAGHGGGPWGWWSAGHGPWGQRWGGETPRQILDRRYASGEIAKDQYDAMKRDIESGSGQP